MSMTLDEARRELQETADACGSGSSTGDAIRVILAALPAPEKRTPGQTCHDGYYRGIHPIPKWREASGQVRWDAGSLAVLREHAVDYVLGRDYIIEAGCQAYYNCDGHLGEIAAFRAAVIVRLAEAEVKP